MPCQKGDGTNKGTCHLRGKKKGRLETDGETVTPTFTPKPSERASRKEDR
jgi:hypothetical protein